MKFNQSLHSDPSSLFSRAFRVSCCFGASRRTITNCDSISTFLTRSCFDDYVQEAKALSEEGSAVIPLIDSVMAFGYQTLLAASQQSKSSEMRRKAITYSRIALRSRDSVLRSPETLLKMQVREMSLRRHWPFVNSSDNSSNGRLKVSAGHSDS